jgi:ABC-type amino acid transport substrate-binding protein
VATVRGSTAETYLRSHGASVRPFTTIDEAYAALRRERVRAVVYDAPILMYHQQRSGDEREAVVGRLFQRQNYGIGLRQDSVHRKPINRAASVQKYRRAHARWFGEEK